MESCGSFHIIGMLTSNHVSQAKENLLRESALMPLCSRPYSGNVQAPIPEKLESMTNKSLKPIDTTSSDFQKLMKEGNLFVDNTKQVYNFLKMVGNYFLIVRPRRMGKSLFLSTIESYYSGNRALFDDTWLGKKDDKFWNDFQKYPVIHIVEPNYPDDGDIKRSWEACLNSQAQKFGLWNRIKEEPLFSKLLRLGEGVANIDAKAKGIEKGKCVILIDEYNRAINMAISEGVKEETLKKVRKINDNIYSNLKDLDSRGVVKKCILTGSSKFAKTSIFSSLNNIKDISEDPMYADLIGIPRKQIEDNKDIQNYVKFIAEKATKENQDRGIIFTEEYVRKELLDYYDGYQFSHDKETKVINPFSLLSFLDNVSQKKAKATKEGKLNLEDYWFQSGTPTNIINKLENYPLDVILKLVADTATIPVTKMETSCHVEDYKNEFLLQLYHAGYLTIKELRSNPKNRIREYVLRFPNKEVIKGFKDQLVDYWETERLGNLMPLIQQKKFEEAFLAIQKFCKDMKICEKDKESVFQSLIFSWCREKQMDGDYLHDRKIIQNKEIEGRGIPDILWITKDKEGRNHVNLIELRVGKRKTGDTPRDQKYIEHAKGDEEIKEFLGEEGLKTAMFRSIYLYFKKGTIDYMEINESMFEEQDIKTVYKKQKEEAESVKQHKHQHFNSHLYLIMFVALLFL